MSACSERPDEPCCIHDLPKGDPHYPGAVCCWCGDIYLSSCDATEHGEYEPKLPPKEP